jgi:hypothetical protein
MASSIAPPVRRSTKSTRVNGSALTRTATADGASDDDVFEAAAGLAAALEGFVAVLAEWTPIAATSAITDRTAAATQQIV